MQTSPLPNSPERLARAAILNGQPVPPTVTAQLEARGVNVGELERRLRESIAHVS